MKQRNPIIRMFNVCKQYGTTEVLKDITFNIGAGEMVFITGPSGAGKSTLLKMIYYAETVTYGQIIIDGMNLARIKPSRLPYLRRRLGIVFQDFKLIQSRNVYDNVALVLEAAGEKKGLIKNKVRHVLWLTGMAEKQHAMPKSLSGGEQQRVAFARAVVGNPSIIIADEPTGNLDSLAARTVFTLLNRYNEKGATVIIASHNMDLIQTTLKMNPRARVIKLADGTLCEEDHNGAFL